MEWDDPTVHQALESLLATRLGWVRYRRGLRTARFKFGEQWARGELLLIGRGRMASALKRSLAWFEEGD